MTTLTQLTKFALLCAALSLTVFGCAFRSQTVTLEPSVDVSSQSIGNQQTIVVQVVDERTNTELGRRGNGALRGAAIKTDADIEAVFSESIINNLRTMGYNAVPADTPGTGVVMRVDVRSIEYETSSGFFTGGVHARGAMKVTATRNQTSYDRLYRVDEEKRTVVVPGANANSRQINTTVSALIQELFDDPALFDFINDSAGAGTQAPTL